MSDQCGYCTVRGDLKECESQPCTTHDSWYVKQLTDRVEKAEARVEELEARSSLSYAIDLENKVKKLEAWKSDAKIDKLENFQKDILTVLDNGLEIQPNSAMHREIKKWWNEVGKETYYKENT